MHGFRFLFLILFIGELAHSSNAEIQKVATGPRWKAVINDLRIRNKDQFYFSHLSPDASNPDLVKELESTLRAFQVLPARSGALELHPACAYPARLDIIGHLLPKSFVRPKCVEFDEWKKKMKLKKVSLVNFSLFPHTLASWWGRAALKLEFISERPSVFLSFTGDRSDTFLKIQETSDKESYWEIALDFSDAERDFFLFFLWELTVNAQLGPSYLLESDIMPLCVLLQGVRPALDLKKECESLTFSPLDFMTSVMKKPLQLTFVPSKRRQALTLTKLLAYDQVFMLVKLLQGSLHWSHVNDPDILEIAVLMLSSSENLKTRERARLVDLKKRLDSKRSSNESVRLNETRAQAIQEQNAFINPMLRRYGTRIQLTGVFDENQMWRSLFGFRLIGRDPLQDQSGFEPAPFVSIGEVMGRYHAGDFSWEKLTLISYQSVNPIGAFDRPSSWSFLLGWERPRERGCVDCFSGVAEAGIGLASSTFSEKSFFMSQFIFRFSGEGWEWLEHRLGFGVHSLWAVDFRPWPGRLTFDWRLQFTGGGASDSILPSNVFTLSESWSLFSNFEIRAQQRMWVFMTKFRAYWDFNLSTVYNF